MQAIFEAIKKGDLQAVKHHIEEHNVDVNFANENLQSLLMVAVQSNDPKIVDYLVSKGANPNQRDNTMLTPWICSGANGFHEVTKVLLKANPDINSVNRFGGTILLPSSEKGYLKTVLMTVDAGVNVNHQNYLGWSALQEAVILGNGGPLYTSIIAYLLKSNADVSLVDFENKTSKAWAIHLGQNKIVDLLDGKAEYTHLNILELLANNRYDEANVLIEQLDETEKYFFLGYLSSLKGDQEKALEIYSKGLEVTGVAEFNLYKAIVYRELRKKEEALSSFDKAIAMSAGNEKTFYVYHKSNYLRELGMHEEAIQVMDSLLADDPKRYDYMFHKANSLRSLGKHQEALDTMNTAIEIVPTASLFKFHAAQSNYLLGDKETALSLLEKVIEMDPKQQYVDYRNSIR